MDDAQTPCSESERNDLDHSASGKALLARRPVDWTVEKGELHPYEVFWRTHQPWLAELGYTVRPRYRADWKASWLAMDPDKYFRSEDAQMLSVRRLIFLLARWLSNSQVEHQPPGCSTVRWSACHHQEIQAVSASP
jgi:hypothetical protein